MIDIATGLLYNVKRPSPEKRNYSVDFKKQLGSITSIISIEVIPITAGATSLTTSGHSVSGPTIVSFDAEGGLDKEKYEIRISVADALGNIITDSVMLKIRETGYL